MASRVSCILSRRSRQSTTGAGPVDPVTPQPTEHKHIERLVACDKFVLERWQLSESHIVGGDGRPHIIATIEGALDLSRRPQR